MASKEIIEVGSSDEEAEPPPKKRKPVPNAMVHIPSRLPGISIKPAKKTSSNSLENIPKTILLNKNVPQKVTIPNLTAKSNKLINPLVTKLKSNAVTIKKSNNTGNTIVYLQDPLIGKQHTLKRASLVSANSPILNKNMLLKKNQVQGPKRIGSNVLSNLPSSITIKKAPSSKSINLPTMSHASQKKVIIRSKPTPSVSEILTVDLDDEDVSDQQPLTSNPQWYIRPEDSQKVVKHIEDDSGENINYEEQNNKEPETSKYVEIIIEDSPIKPAERHCNEIGNEITVTIDDSPYKNKSDDEEKINHGKNRADSHSRKKLKYPNEQQSIRQIVEIEIDTTTVEKENNEINISDDITKEPLENKTENDCQNKQELEQEFHSVYQKFIETCFENENSDDMKKIVEKKIKAYYKQCPKEYVNSEEFIDMVSSKTASIKAGPDKMYLYIKDVVDELNMQRKLAKSQEAEVVPTEQSLNVIEEDVEYDTKRSRQIRKLEKTIKQLHRAIQKLEEQEVDLEDEENSMYLLTERYKERLVRVHAKFRQMTNTKMPSEPRIVIEARMGCPQGPAKKLEKFINKKVPIGTPLPFPDFHDVIRCVREANEEDGIGWSNMEIEAEARDLFERCGKKLKRRRQENEWRISVASRIPTDSQDKDPAEDNIQLKQKLSENKLIAAKRESEILNKYADRQNQLKLEGEEIDDKEEEESAGESEEEEVGESHLEDREKRKEILKKLIKEKHRKALNKTADNSTHNAENNNKNLNPALQCDDENVISVNANDLEPESYDIVEPTDVDNDNLNSKHDKETESNVIDIDSDIDELHLLQKLRFEDDIITSSSDSDSTIAISDSLESESDGENDKIVCSDIISIENSSYSESETQPDEVGVSNFRTEVSSNDTKDPAAESLKNAKLVDNQISNKTNDEDSIKNIFLAASEEDATSEKEIDLGKDETCTNSKDEENLKKATLVDNRISNKSNDEDSNIFLASSEEDATFEKEIDIEKNKTCTNSKHDMLSLTDKIVEEGDEPITNENDDVLSLAGNVIEKDNKTSMNVKNDMLRLSDTVIDEEDETCTNLKDDMLSITDMVIGENTDHNKDLDELGIVKENELNLSNKEIIEDIQSISTDSIEPKDDSELFTSNDNAAAHIELDTSSEKIGNMDNIVISEVRGTT